MYAGDAYEDAQPQPLASGCEREGRVRFAAPQRAWKRIGDSFDQSGQVRLSYLILDANAGSWQPDSARRWLPLPEIP
jgi:hypothetical protein